MKTQTMIGPTEHKTSDQLESCSRERERESDAVDGGFARTQHERELVLTPIVLSALHIDGVSLLHLPAESFIEYQLRAQRFAPERFVASAAYGDGGPWYIPTKEAYPQGGYEIGVAFSDPSVDAMMTAQVRELLA